MSISDLAATRAARRVMRRAGVPAATVAVLKVSGGIFGGFDPQHVVTHRAMRMVNAAMCGILKAATRASWSAGNHVTVQQGNLYNF